MTNIPTMTLWFYFLDCCTEGKLDEAKTLHNTHNYNRKILNDVFKYTCRDNKFEVAKWLYSLGGIDIHTSNDVIFRCVCGRSNIEFAQWLYSLGGVDIHNENDDAFYSSIYNENILVAKWLYSLGGVKIDRRIVALFDIYCVHLNKSVAEWLYSIGSTFIDPIIIERFVRSWIFGEHLLERTKIIYSVKPICINVTSPNDTMEHWYSRCGCLREGTYYEAFELI